LKTRRSKIFGTIAASILGLVLICFAIYLYLYYPRKAEPFEMSAANPTRSILIATQGSEFKNDLIKSLCDSLIQSSTHIKGIDIGDLATVDEREWDSILIINSLIININKHASHFIAQSQTPEKILLLVTSGGADWQPKPELRVEAITSASRKQHANGLMYLISDWIENEVHQPWTPDDYLLALTYAPKTNIKLACEAIASEQARYQAIYPNFVTAINRIGYQYLRLNDIQAALVVFKLNVKLFPNTWNVYDSYGEALLKNGDRETAIENYRQALAINPESKSASDMLIKLGSKTTF
jgi:Tetratricopeptide repeat